MSRVEVKIDAGALSSYLRANLEPAVKAAAERTRDKVVQNISSAGRVDTGRMRDTVYVQALSTSAESPRYEVGSDLHYTIYQEEGVVGPIVPRRAKVLRFRPKGAMGYVFARSTSGFAGAFMFRKALDALTVRDFLP